MKILPVYFPDLVKILGTIPPHLAELSDLFPLLEVSRRTSLLQWDSMRLLDIAIVIIEREITNIIMKNNITNIINDFANRTHNLARFLRVFRCLGMTRSKSCGTPSLPKPIRS